MGRIQKIVKVAFVSLCPKGANGLRTLYKEDDGSFDLEMLTKALDTFDEKGEIVGVMYAPELRDSQGDIASADVVKEMAYSFARDGQGIDIRHDGRSIPKSDAFVAESFIVQKGDPRFADMKKYDGTDADVTGAWGVVLKIDSPDLRKLYREGKWAGLSMGGKALVSTEKADEARRKENEMDKETLAAILKENREQTATLVSSAIEKAVEKLGTGKPAEPAPIKKEDKKPVFKSVKDLRKARLEAAKVEILEKLDASDEEACAEAEERIAEIDKQLSELSGKKVAKSDDTIKDEDAGIKADDPDDVKQLKKEKYLAEQKLQKALAKSSQDTGDGGEPKPKDGEPKAIMTGLAKEDTDLMAAGMRFGAAITKNRGY